MGRCIMLYCKIITLLFGPEKSISVALYYFPLTYYKYFTSVLLCKLQQASKNDANSYSQKLLNLALLFNSQQQVISFQNKNFSISLFFPSK